MSLEKRANEMGFDCPIEHAACDDDYAAQKPSGADKTTADCIPPGSDDRVGQEGRRRRGAEEVGTEYVTAALSKELSLEKM